MNCHYYNYSLDYFLETQHRLGFETVALWGGAPHFDLDYLTFGDCGRIRRAAHRLNLDIACFTAAGCTYGYQMGMQPADMREKSYQYFANGIRAAAELGCRFMVTNSGWGYWNEDRETAWERSAEMLCRLCDIAEAEGITLTMESLRRAESQLVTTLADARRMAEAVNHPRLKLMVDTTAVRVAGETCEQWLEAFGDELVNAHFVDGTPYGHLVWGDGNAPLEQLLDSFQSHGYEGLYGLEVTDSRYYEDPAEADRRNMEALKRFFDE